RQEAEIVTGIGAVEVAVGLEVAPVAILFTPEQALNGGARHDRERDALPYVRRIARPGTERLRAHRARAIALRPEHVAVDRERFFAAEQPGEIGSPVLAFEAIVANDWATRRQRPALRGDACNMPAEPDSLRQQRCAGGAIFYALVWELHRVEPSELGGWLESRSLNVHRQPPDDRSRKERPASCEPPERSR